MARWVTVREAADVLGLSQDTVKRRLKNGELVGRREKIPNGFKWFVQVDGEPATVPTMATTVDTTVEDESHHGDTVAEESSQVALLTLEVELLRREKGEQDAELGRVWAQLEARTREVEELHVLLQRAQEQRAPLYLPPQHSGDTTVSATVQLRQALIGSWWWKRFFAPERVRKSESGS